MLNRDNHYWPLYFGVPLSNTNPIQSLKLRLWQPHDLYWPACIPHRQVEVVYDALYVTVLISCWCHVDVIPEWEDFMVTSFTIRWWYVNFQRKSCKSCLFLSCTFSVSDSYPGLTQRRRALWWRLFGQTMPPGVVGPLHRERCFQSGKGVHFTTFPGSLFMTLSYCFAG